MTAAELGDAFRSREASPVEVAEAVLARIDAVDGSLNAFCLVDPAETLRQARASELRFGDGVPLSPLDGVPVAVKDVFLTNGWPTRKGSATIDPEAPWDVDAPAVARLREAGAVFSGKTTTPEFGWKGVTDGPLEGITRNPWNPAKTPGGSSGGSAAALASGASPLALGTDGGGSIRIPGGFTGVVGFKPTFALVPHWPMSPFGTLAHSGPMARTVEDTAMLLEVLSGYDPRDWTSLPGGIAGGFDGLDDGIAGLRVAFSPTLGYAEVDPDVAASVASAVEVLGGLGAGVEEADPGFDDPRRAFEVLWYAAAAAVVGGVDEARRGLLDPGLVEIAAEGAGLSTLEYMSAFRERVAVAVRLSEFLSEYDVLVTPTLPIPAFDAGREVPSGWHEDRWQTWTPFSVPFNLSQQPALTVPCGLTGDGLPVGLQIVGAKGREDVVLRVARAYERDRTDDGHDHFTRPRG